MAFRQTYCVYYSKEKSVFRTFHIWWCIFGCEKLEGIFSTKDCLYGNFSNLHLSYGFFYYSFCSGSSFIPESWLNILLQ